MSNGLSALFTWRSAIASSSSDLTSTERLVALVLSLYMNEKGASCFPSVPTISAASGLSDRAVQKALRSIEAKEWLAARLTSGGKRGRTNTYRAAFPQWYVERVNEVHPSEPEGVNDETARGERGSPDLVKDYSTKTKDGLHESNARPADVVAADAGGRFEELEAWLSRQGYLYADDRLAFGAEVARFGSYSEETIDELRARGLTILRAAEARGEAT